MLKKRMAAFMSIILVLLVFTQITVVAAESNVGILIDNEVAASGVLFNLWENKYQC